MKSIRDVEITGKRVLVRVDFNVPMDAERKITDETRIRQAIPTLKYALEQGAKLIVASHLGRPKGKPVPEFSMAPVSMRLADLLDAPVKTALDCVGPEVRAMVNAMADGEVVLLENLRFHAGETEDDSDFARELASLCDVYVNDAFAVCHRRNASVGAITEHAPISVAGFLLQNELDYFEMAMKKPQRPLVAIIGGAKVSSKLNALKNMLDKVDKIIIGGAMANTFLKYTGIDVGKSLVEEEMVVPAGELLQAAEERGIKLYLPVDVVVGDRFAPDAVVKNVPVREIPPEWMALDIGPASSRLFAEVLADARTIVWNGPMGAFEMDAFSRGTLAMVDDVANAHALSIVGGGDTDTAVHMAGGVDRISYISTGGGAFLTLLEGKDLPAVTALKAAQER